MVAEQAAHGLEAILGVTQDPAFGPVVMFGLGGVLVEALGDVSFRVAPFGPAEPRRMIDEIRSRKLWTLSGARPNVTSTPSPRPWRVCRRMQPTTGQRLWPLMSIR